MAGSISARPDRVGMFLNPEGQRRVDFRASCGDLFSRLFVADGAEQACCLLGQRPDLLVIDLERFDRRADLAALGAVVAQSGDCAVLVICPYAQASWLPALMAYGALDYAIGPLVDAELRELIGHANQPRAVARAGSGRDDEFRALLAIRDRVQLALIESDDQGAPGERLCRALCGFPGVSHAALFNLMEMGDLRMEAQFSPQGIDLLPMLGQADRLRDARLGQVFPALTAAGSGELALLDAPEKAGDPELAIGLGELGVEMVLGLPIMLGSGGAPRGALSLMFGARRQFSSDELGTFAGLAQLAGLGLRMAEMSRESEQLLGNLTSMATADALTGALSRRQGDDFLDQEIRRARRYAVPLALICFDIDHFRILNERFGHDCGDTALCVVAATARSVMRAPDLLVRVGGAQFMVIAPHTSAVEALQMAEKIRAAIAVADMRGCGSHTVSLSVAQLGEQESGEGLSGRLEAALARAKRAGRNCVELAMQ